MSALFLLLSGPKKKRIQETCFQELTSEKLLIYCGIGPLLEIIIVSSNFQALLFWQDKLLESV